MSGGELTVIFTIIGVGVAIAGLNLASFRSLRSEMGGVEKRLGERLDGLEKRLDGLEKRLDNMAAEIAALRERVAKLEGKLEGLLEGLRESLVPTASAGRAERR